MRTSRFLIVGGLLAILFSACSKVIIYEPTDEENKLYAKLYIPKAERGNIYYAVSTGQASFAADFNVVLGGTKNAEKNISLSVEVDPAKIESFNTENGTNYKILPTENYVFERSNYSIPSGSRSSDVIRVKINPDQQLQIFETYLLPLTLKGNDASLSMDAKFSTVYYVFQVSYPAGQVPRQQVLSLGSSWGLFIGPGSRGSLMLKRFNHDIVSYIADQDGIFRTSPNIVGVNWDASESWYLLNDQSIVFRNHPYWAGLFSFKINSDYSMVQSNPFWLGDFWDKYMLIPFKNYLLTVDAAGVMYRQPALTDINVVKTEVGNGFTGYKQLLSFKDKLLALESNGKLWVYNMTELAVPSNRRLLGEGWDMYDKIIALNDDIVAVDAQGEVYRYTDLRTDGFYPIK